MRPRRLFFFKKKRLHVHGMYGPHFFGRVAVFKPKEGDQASALTINSSEMFEEGQGWLYKACCDWKVD